MSEESKRKPRHSTTSEQIGEAVGHTVDATAFLGSILAGMLLGWIADSVFDTGPVFIVLGIGIGSVVGFWRMWVTYTGKGRHGR